MFVIDAIRVLLRAELITPRQAARIALKYIDQNGIICEKGGESTSAQKHKDDSPIVCPTCRQVVLPF